MNEQELKHHLSNAAEKAVNTALSEYKEDPTLFSTELSEVENTKEDIKTWIDKMDSLVASVLLAIVATSQIYDQLETASARKEPPE